MNELRNFDFKGHEIRTIKIDNEPYFVGKDIADVLEYQNGSRDVNRHVEEEDRKKIMLFDGNQNKETIVINESGLYSLILSSKLPTAKEFKHWVTSEVLPAIRRNGAYLTDQKAFDITHNKDSLADLLFQAGEQLKQKNLQIIEMKPKALFADAVATSHTTILVGDLAKLLKQNGVEVGGKRLFAWLRRNGYLIKRHGADYNSPTQYAMELGLFEVKETAISHSDGHVTVQKTPKVTGKGQQYFVNKLLQARSLELD